MYWMMDKTVIGRKSLNAMIRHIAFHGHVEMPDFYTQRHEFDVIYKLTDDNRVTTARNSNGEYQIVLIDSTLYPVPETAEPAYVEPLVAHLASSNPRIEHLSKGLRKNCYIPQWEPQETAEAEYAELLDAID